MNNLLRSHKVKSKGSSRPNIMSTQARSSASPFALPLNFCDSQPSGGLSFKSTLIPLNQENRSVQDQKKELQK